ncbi:MAG: hypothetical protein ABH865_05500 [Candidatus Omnitrophota bacterium]
MRLPRLADMSIVGILVMLFLCVAVPRFQFPDLDHGDDYQDADVLNSGTNFERFGFVACRFLPVLQLGLESPRDPYTHYPPLPQIINGVLRKVFKTGSLSFFRAVALLVSLANFLFWYWCVLLLTRSRGIGIISAIFYLTNPFFIYGIDSLSEFLYADALRSVILFVFLYRQTAARPGRWLAWVLWGLIFTTSLVSFEYIIFFSLFFILCRYFLPSLRAPSWKLIVFLCTAPVAGFLLHFIQNAWYFADASRAFDDLRSSATERIVASKDSSLSLNFSSWWREVVLRNVTLVFIFNHFLLLFSFFVGYLARRNLSGQDKARAASLGRFFVILFICGLTWYVFFPSHSLAHTYVLFLARHLVPAATIGFSLLFFILFAAARNAPQYAVVIKNICITGGVIFVAVSGISRTGLPVTKDLREYARDFFMIKQCLVQLRVRSDKKDTIAINYHRSPFVRYYTDRFVQNIFGVPELTALHRLPRYFIFMPYNNKPTAELLEFLQEQYMQVLESRSRRFPALVFELKAKQP